MHMFIISHGKVYSCCLIYFAPFAVQTVLGFRSIRRDVIRLFDNIADRRTETRLVRLGQFGIGITVSVIIRRLEQGDICDRN